VSSHLLPRVLPEEVDTAPSFLNLSPGKSSIQTRRTKNPRSRN
jgi:hypothetical protein